MLNIVMLKRECEMLASEISMLEKELGTMPNEHLCCYHDGDSVKCFAIADDDSTKRRYLRKSKREETALLARKGYLKARLADAKQQKKALELCIRQYPEESEVERYCAIHADRTRYIEESIVHPQENIRQWVCETYPMNMQFPDKKNVAAVDGSYVRSKSEAIILRCLYENGIPYRYESEVQIESGVIYPDFVILKPSTGEKIIWEHFGLADSENYARNINLKLQSYRGIGYYPMINLITTYETASNPLDYRLVELLVRHFCI